MHSEQELKSQAELAKENQGKTVVFTKDKNALQGAADFIANVNLGYNYNGIIT